MRSTNEQVFNALQIFRTMGLEPPQPETIGRKGNPEHHRMLEIYCDALRPFQVEDIEAGLRNLMKEWRGSGWPKPAHCREYCLEAERRHRKPKALPKPVEPETPRMTEEDRARNLARFERLKGVLQSGGDPNKCREWIDEGKREEQADV